MSLKSDTMQKDIANYYSKEIDRKYKKGVDNFVYLMRLDFLSSECSDFKNPECLSRVNSTASGLVFSSDQKSVFVLTAAHFCVDQSPGTFDTKIIGFTKDLDRELYILKKDEKNDICLLMGVKYDHESFNQIKLAKKDPPLGEDVYTVAAPNGVGGPGFRLVFDGKFGGCDQTGCMTTIPATFGSSGAGIYNKKGELITIVMAVTQDFENLVLSPSRSSIRKFIKNIDKDVDIYSYEE